jgi:hypothetical protein
MASAGRSGTGPHQMLQSLSGFWLKRGSVPLLSVTQAVDAEASKFYSVSITHGGNCYKRLRSPNALLPVGAALQTLIFDTSENHSPFVLLHS